MNKIYNLSTSIQGKDGKTHWNTCGLLMIGEKGGKERISVKLNSIPAGEWNGWFSAFERTDNQANTSTDDIEF
jgi:hypothetical protein